MFDLRDFNRTKQMSVDSIVAKTNKPNKKKTKQEEADRLIAKIKSNTFKQNIKELKEYLGGEVQFWIFIVFMITIGLPILLEIICLYVVFRIFGFLL